MKIFVTGGSGFIGKRFVRRLRDTEHEILCLVRETTDVRALQDAGISLTRGDVTDKDSLLRGMRGCDCVVNLANLFEFWVPDRRAYQEVNVNGTRNVMEAAIATGIQNSVHVSTAAVFGNAEWPVTEASEMGPVCLSEYARSKRDGDAVVWDLYDQEQLPVLMVCPGAVIGPDDPKSCRAILQKRGARQDAGSGSHQQCVPVGGCGGRGGGDSQGAGNGREHRRALPSRCREPDVRRHQQNVV